MNGRNFNWFQFSCLYEHVIFYERFFLFYTNVEQINVYKRVFPTITNVYKRVYNVYKHPCKNWGSDHVWGACTPSLT